MDDYSDDDEFFHSEEEEWDGEEEEEEDVDDDNHLLGVRLDEQGPLVPVNVEDDEEFPPLPPAHQAEALDEPAEEAAAPDLILPEAAEAKEARVAVKKEKAEIEVIGVPDEDSPFVYLDEDEENVLCCPICLEHMNEVFGFTSKGDANGACTHWVCEACAVDMKQRAGGGNFECPFCRREVTAYSRNLIATQILQQLQRRHKEGQVLARQMQTQRQTLEQRLQEEREARDAQTQELVQQIRQLQVDSQQYIEELQNGIDAERQEKMALEAAVGGLQEEHKRTTMRSNEAIKKMEMQLERLRINGEQSKRAFEQEKRKLLNMEKNSQKHAQREIEAMRLKVGRMKQDLDASNSVQVGLQKKCSVIVRQLYDKEREMKNVRWTMAQLHKEPTDNGVIGTVQSMLTSWWWNSGTDLAVTNLTGYKFLETRGNRRDGRVRRARNRQLQKIVALKRVPYDHALLGNGNLLSNTVTGLWQMAVDGAAAAVDPELLDRARTEAFREVMLLRTLDHPQIIPVCALVSGGPKGTFHMELPYFEHDLGHLSKVRKFTEMEVKGFMHQVLLAVHYLHSGGVVHRLISPSAIVMDTIQRVYLAGFSQAIHCDSITRDTAPVVRQNICFAAPELLYKNNEQQSPNAWPAIDMWALGCTLAAVFLRRNLFCASSDVPCAEKSDILYNQFQFVECLPQDMESCKFELVKAALKKRERSGTKPASLARLLQRNGAPPEAADLICKLLAFHRMDRWTAQDALDHEYFANLRNKDEPMLCPFYAELQDSQVAEFAKKHCLSVL